MKPEQQAQQLADWLDAHPGTEPPADLDPDVVEATYVLRPDLAPAARVTVDDILAGITTGPLLDATGGYATEDEVPDDHAPTQPVQTDDGDATEDEVEPDEPAPTEPVWKDDEQGYATEDEVEDEHAPTQPVWVDDDYATDDEVEDEDSPTELASRLANSATPKPVQALDASSPIEALDASSPLEALDASSPLEASDQEPPTKASTRSSEERQNDAAAKARARLSVLPSPEERAKLDAEKEEADRRRRRRAFWARSTGGLALAAVVILAMKSVVLAPSEDVSPEEPTAVSGSERIFDDKEDGVQAQLEPREEALAEGEPSPENSAKPDAPPPPDADPAATGRRTAASRESGEGRETKKAEAASGADFAPLPRPAPAPMPRPAPAAMTRPAPEPAPQAAPQAASEPAAPAVSAPPPPPPELAAATHTTRGGAPTGGATGGLVSSKDEAEPAPMEDADDAVAALDDLAFDVADNGAELAETEEASSDAAGYVEGDSRARLAKESGAVTEAISRGPRSQDRKRRDHSGSVAAESAPATTADVSTAADAPVQQTGAAELRAAAYPADLPPMPSAPSSTAIAEYRVANTAADAYLNTGQPREAAAQLQQHVAAPADVGMANAARAAEIYLSIGAWSDAAGVSRSGLALSAKNTPWRSLLFVRLGDALRGLGDEAGAAEAYRSASALNAAR